MARTYFFWDDLEDNIIEEYDEAGATIADYTTEPDQFGNVISQHRSGQSSFFHYDALGSTLALTNDNQQVSDSYAYTAFGEGTESTGSTDNPFQYIGQSQYYRDSVTGQCMVRQRADEPTRARWLSRDPTSVSNGSSLYAYVFSNPTNYVAPLGTLLAEDGPFKGIPTKRPDLDLEQLEKKIFWDSTACKNKCRVEATSRPGLIRWVSCDGKGKLTTVVSTDVTVKPVHDLMIECGTDSCSESHERYHVKQFEAMCPDICKDQKAGCFVGWANEACLNKAECFGNMLHLLCLYKLRAMYKTKDKTTKDGMSCLKRVNDEIDAKKKVLKETYLCENLFIVIPEDIPTK